MRLQHLSLSSVVTTSLAVTNLYVSSYSGTISSLQLGQTPNGYSLSTVSVSTGCSASPSWLTKNERNGVVYCVNEGLNGQSTVASLKTCSSGKLTLIDSHSTVGGPVSSVVYNKGKALAVAHYGGSALSTYKILPTGGLVPLQNISFTMSSPGPNPGRQNAPHPHQALVDPTDSFIIIPDLGADLLRVFSINPQTSSLTASTSFSAPPGSGPRHGDFLSAASGTYFFLHTEIANTVISYKVTYGKTSLGFKEVFRSGSYGNQSTPAGAAAAEAFLSPNKKQLLTSSRNASLFNIPAFPPSNSGSTIPSDTLQAWEINPSTGALTFKQLAPAGGRFPRQFSVNKNGTLAAVGLQRDGRVVIVERDVESGLFGKFVASVNVAGEITCVIWDE